jgi:hypothetical protein
VSNYLGRLGGDRRRLRLPPTTRSDDKKAEDRNEVTKHAGSTVLHNGMPLSGRGGARATLDP